MAMNRIKLEVCGVTCVLLTEESEAYMKALSEEAEKLISSLLYSSGSVSVAAVTAALSYLDEKKKKETELERVLAESRRELEELRGQLREAKAEKATQEGKKRPARSGGPLKNPLREFDNLSAEGLVSFYEKKE